MAKKPEAQGNGTNIARVGKRKWGYDSQQVDEFLENAHRLYESAEPRLTQKDIQDVSFGLRKNGYAVGQVDAALARLERAVVDKQTQWEISQRGRVAWRGQTEAMYRKFMNHCDREENERFKSGVSNNPSYDKKQVDSLLDQLAEKLTLELGEDSSHAQESGDLVDLTPNRVSNVVFTQRKGSKGYDERQVDYFLNFGVQLLSRIESFARVTDYSAAETPGFDEPQNHPVTQQDSPLDSLAALAEPTNPNVEETQVFQPVSFDPAQESRMDEAHQQGVGQSTESIRPLFDSNGASIQTPTTRMTARNRDTNDIPNSYANRTYAGDRAFVDGNENDVDAREDFKNLHRAEQQVFNQSEAQSRTVEQPAAEHTAPQQAVSSDNLGDQVRDDESPASAHDSYSSDSPAAQSTTPSTFDFWGRRKAVTHDETTTRSMSFAEQPNGEVNRDAQQPGETANTTQDSKRPSIVQNNATQDEAETRASSRRLAEESPLSFPVEEQATSQSNHASHATVTSQDSISPQSDDTSASHSNGSDSRTGADQTAYEERLDTIQDTDQYLASLNSMLDSTSFPKVDLDIPDLAFPTTDSLKDTNTSTTSDSTAESKHEDNNDAKQ